MLVYAAELAGHAALTEKGDLVFTVVVEVSEIRDPPQRALVRLAAAFGADKKHRGILLLNVAQR